MPRVPGAEAIYSAADQFRQRCLQDGASLLWPEAQAWTKQNLNTLRAAFVDRPDPGDRTFMEKWRDQIADQPRDVQRIAADLLAFYYLFPVSKNISAERKLREIRDMSSWASENAPSAGLAVLEQAYAAGGIGATGVFYSTNRYRQLWFYLDFAIGVLDGEADPDDAASCKRLADKIREQVGGSGPARNILLHLLFPDDFEAIASDRNREQILKAFRDLVGSATDDDDRLREVRSRLGRDISRPDFSFYEQDIRNRWQGEGEVGRLSDIADLLERMSLTDEQLLNQKWWRENVRPITRPFLESVSRGLEQKALLYRGQNVARKRSGFDYLMTEQRPYAGWVSVGHADTADGDLERRLVWGIQAWGPDDRAAEYAARLSELAPEGWRVRTIPGRDAIEFSGSTVLLYRALGADELRAAEAGDLAQEIANDVGELVQMAEVTRGLPQVWIEKTIVRGRRDRLEGDYALGKLLWSPQKAKGGADIYRFMRDVQPGDIILHLTDNEAFTGVSRAASPVLEFGGVANTEWGEGPSYKIELEDFRVLDPVLHRDVFFAPPHAKRLVELIDKGAKHLFYNREPSLNQGAYLTPAPHELVEILDEAYFQLAGKRLVSLARPPESEDAGLMLVGAVKQTPEVAQELERLAAVVADRGKAAWWWSYGLNESHRQVLDDSGYLYLYAGQPLQKITHRLHVEDARTSPDSSGIVCPWPDHAEDDLRGRERVGDQKDQIFRTWFLVDRVEALDSPIPLASLENHDGQPAVPVAMRAAFALWRRRRDRSSALDELSRVTFLPATKLRELETLLAEKKQVILEGPPGSGKTYLAGKLARYFTGNPLDGEFENVRVVQFHQSYGYEDFIEGIRPETKEAGQIEYHVRSGTFKQFCEIAERNLEKRFVLVIDEINRGNISRIFGELLYALEYRDEAVHLAYSKPDDAAFRIPKNVYVIGTMNTTDRSLAQIDYALRRRFYFYRLLPVEDGQAEVLSAWLREETMDAKSRRRVLALFLRLNQMITEAIDEHHQIGHSYFMQPGVAADVGLRQVWDRAVLPLIEEYFFNRRDRRELLATYSLDAVERTISGEAPAEEGEDDAITAG